MWVRAETSTSPGNQEVTNPYKPRKLKLTIKVISGSQIGQPTEDTQAKEQLNPFVKIIVKGTPADEKANPPFKTKIVEDGKVQPLFDETHIIILEDHDKAVLVFDVLHNDLLGQERLGFYAVPVSCIR